MERVSKVSEKLTATAVMPRESSMQHALDSKPTKVLSKLSNPTVVYIASDCEYLNIRPFHIPLVDC